MLLTVLVVVVVELCCCCCCYLLFGCCGDMRYFCTSACRVWDDVGEGRAGCGLLLFVMVRLEVSVSVMGERV